MRARVAPEALARRRCAGARAARRVAAASALGALLAGAAPGATSISVETRESDGDAAPHHSQVIADGERLRVDDASTRVLYHADRGVLWILDRGDQSYVEIDQGQAQALARRVEQARSEARARLASLPPEQRAATEALLDGAVGEAAAPAPRLTLRETGRSDRVAGVPCQELDVLRDGARVATLCRARFADANVPPERFAAIRELAAFAQQSAAMLMPEGLRDAGLTALGVFGDLDGLPLRLRAYRDGALEVESQVVAIEELAEPAAAFELPAGYQPRVNIQVRQRVGGP